jgi:serine/threonine protein kinase
MDPLIGKSFGPYRILEQIGQGGMAVVYKGFQQSLNRYVAVKVLRAELAQDPTIVARFREEALAVANLNHPNILYVYDAGIGHGVYYIVQDYIDGGSLRDLINLGPLSTEHAVSIATQVAEALDHAHQAGVVHRDVKPANILLTKDGRPLISDFGIAKVVRSSERLTRTGTSIGTPEYMAPEQALGQAVDGRTDLYALGIVLYEMLTGQVPFHGETPLATLYQHVNRMPTLLRDQRATLPDWLEDVVHKALAKRPELRYQRGMALAEDLRQRAALQPARTADGPAREAPPAEPRYRPAGDVRPRRRWPIRLLAGVIPVLFVALIAAGVYLFSGRPGLSPTPVPTAMAQAPTQTLAPTRTSASTSIPTPTPPPTREPDTPPPTVGVTLATRTPTSSPSRTPSPTSLPGATPSATSPAPTRSPTPLPPQDPGSITSFETMGTWRRGDEPNGTLVQSSEQVHTGAYAGKLTYRFTTVGNDYVVFLQSHLLSGTPNRITAWVYGDGAGHFLNVWIQDNAGQVWQAPLGQVTHTGWQQMTARLDTSQDWPWGHIAGPDNGQIDYPISFHGLVLDDTPDPFVGSGTVYLDDLRTDSQAAPLPASSPTALAQASTATAVPATLEGQIAFAVYNAAMGGHTLYVARPDGSDVHAIADHVHQPDFRSDAARLVVNGSGGSREDLWSLRPDGTDWRQMTTHPDDFFPTWSPNGQAIAFSSSRQGDSNLRLYVGASLVPSHASESILGDYVLWLPTWELAFNACDYGWGSGSHCGLWRVSSAGGSPVQITDNPQDLPTDGTGVEVLFLRPEGSNWDVYRVGLAGGSPTRLTDHPARDGPAAFSPDGQRIAFLSDRQGVWALYTMDRNGGNVQKRFDLPSGGGYDGSPHPWTSERISWAALP